MNVIDSFKYAAHIIGVIEKDKDLIAKDWIEQPLTKVALKKNSINPFFFVKHFGVRVIQYFVDVINQKEEIGNCPVMIIMLKFFQNKNISMSDLFTICSGLKNAIINYIYEENLINKRILIEFEYALDKNFEGVMIEYNALLAKDTNKTFTPTSENIIKKDIIKRTYADEILDSHLMELKELEEDISDLSVMISTGKTDKDTLVKITECLGTYGNILTAYSITKDLGFGIMDLSNVLIQYREFIDSMENKEHMSLVLDGLINDLMEWRKCMFESGIESFDSMNPSILSSIDSLVSVVSRSDNSENSDLELF